MAQFQGIYVIESFERRGRAVEGRKKEREGGREKKKYTEIKWGEIYRRKKVIKPLEVWSRYRIYMPFDII